VEIAVGHSSYLGRIAGFCIFAGLLAPSILSQEKPDNAPKMEPAESSYPYFIDFLRQKDFSSAEIRVVKLLEENTSFSRYLITYNSDSLRISGMMNVPKGQPPFKTVILNHGHYDSGRSSVGLGFKAAADFFVEKGYVAIGSDFRNRGSSDKGSEKGAICDVLFLTAATKKLPFVDINKIAMWGYSGGGGLTLKSLVVDKDIKVAALFGSMSADERDNYKLLKSWHSKLAEDIRQGIGKPSSKNKDLYARLSVITYISDISAPIIIHHGQEDANVPVKLSAKLFKALTKNKKTAEFYRYPKQPHVLKGEAWNLAMKRTLDFFDRYLNER
jgi:dipeptidyl aminopeptidase/acylaminoacyl peptidase